MKDDYTISHYLAYTVLSKCWENTLYRWEPDSNPRRPPLGDALPIISGRASFWGDACIVRKWTRNLRTKIRKCVPTKWRNESRISKAPLPLSKDSAKYWNVVRKRCALSFHNTRVPSVIVCLMCRLGRGETESRFLRALCASLPWFCVQLDLYAY